MKKIIEGKGTAIVFVAIIFLVCIFSYSKVPFLFFQQDEIYGFGLFIKDGWQVVMRGFLTGSVRHFVPVTMSLSYFLYSVFGTNYVIYNSIGLLFHLLNGLLIYFLAKKLLNKNYLALITTALFYSSGVALQLITWPVINLNAISLTFALLSWLVILGTKLTPVLKSILLPILLFLSICSVEYAAGLIIFIPTAYFLHEKGKIRQKFIRLIPFAATVLIYLAVRFIPIIQNQKAVGGFGGEPSLFVNLFSLVIKYSGQLLVGQSVILFISNLIQGIIGFADQGEAYAENVVFPVVSAGIGFAFLVFSSIYFKFRKKDGPNANNFLLSVLFVVLSSLPFIMVPGKEGLVTIVSSRYMYFGLAGMVIFFGFITKALLNSRRKCVSIAALAGILLVIIFGTTENFNKVNALYEQGKLRMKILNTVKLQYPDLPDKVIFYAQSDTSYYGLPEEDKIFPFQSGLGHTLLVYYSPTEKFPKDLYPGDYLWPITSEGYREIAGRGFGFFMDLKQLKNTFKEYNMQSDSVIAFSWSGKTNQLTDITSKIRSQLSK